LAQLQPATATGSGQVRPVEAVTAQAAPPPAAAGTAPSAAAAAGAEGSPDPRFEKVGFAKLLGDGLEYFIRKYEIVMGRRSKVGVQHFTVGVSSHSCCCQRTAWQGVSHSPSNQQMSRATGDEEHAKKLHLS
jgi:hypothetical protein